MPQEVNLLVFLEDNSNKSFRKKVTNTAEIFPALRKVSEYLKTLISTVLVAFDGNFVAEQISKYRSNVVEVQILKDGQLKKQFAVTNEKMPIDKLSELSDQTIIKIILGANLREFLNSSENNFTEFDEKFSKDLYKMINFIFQNNAENTSDEEKNKQKNFCYLINFLQEVLQWQKKILNFLVFNHYVFDAFLAQLSQVRFHPNFKETSLEMIIEAKYEELKKQVENVNESYQKFKNIHPHIFNNFELKYTNLGEEILSEHGHIINYNEQPFFNFFKTFLLEKKWPEVLNNQDRALARLLSDIQNIAAYQLTELYKVSSSGSNSTIYEEIKKLQLTTPKTPRSRSLSVDRKTPEQKGTKKLERSRSRSFTDLTSLSKERDDSAKKYEETTRKLAKKETVTSTSSVRSKLFHFSFFSKKSKNKSEAKLEKINKEAAVPASDNPGKNNYELIVKLLPNLNQLLSSQAVGILKTYVTDMEKFTENFEKQIRAIDSTWLKEGIEKFLVGNLLEKKLKLIFLTQIFDPFIYVLPEDFVNDKLENLPLTKEVENKAIESDIEKILVSKPDLYRDKSSDYKKITPLTMVQIFSFFDREAFDMLNAYKLPSEASERHRFEVAMEELIKIIKAFLNATKTKENYNSFFFKFFDVPVLLINGHIGYCFRQIIDIWFFFNYLDCGIKKLELKSSTKEMKELTELVQKLMTYDLAKRTVATLLLNFFSNNNSALTDFEEVVKLVCEEDYKKVLMEQVSQLDAKDLSKEEQEKIKNIQTYFIKLTGDLTTQFSTYHPAMQQLLTNINDSGLNILYKNLFQNSCKAEIAGSLLESLKGVNLTTEELIKSDSHLQKHLTTITKEDASELPTIRFS